MPLRTFFLEGEAGRIECLLKTPGGALVPTGGAVVCHPHPVYGGTMHSKVVYAAATALAGRGLGVVRFNFRSAGLSDGAHDGGAGEGRDLRRVLDHVAAEFPDGPVVVAGYSFGAWVGLRVGCADPRVGRLIGIGVPCSLYDFSFLETCSKPVTLIQGGRDRFGTLEEAAAVATLVPGGGRLEAVPAAGHDFGGHLQEIRVLVAAAAGRARG